MKILITGGAGFIGSHVAEALVRAGHKVLAFDNLARGRRENLPKGIELMEADICDPKAVAGAFEYFRPQAVSHQAAQVSVRDSVDDPLADARSNIMGSLTVLEACRRHNVTRFVFASTGGAIYGEQEQFPAKEDHPQRPLSPYAVSKLAVEKYLYFYQQSLGLNWTALRYSNVYGPRQDPFGEAGAVAIFCKKMLDGQTPVINGDGGQTRDFVYVADVARANLLCIERGARGAFNVSTGIETSINHVFHLIKQLTGSDAEEVHGPPKQGEQRRSVLDPSLAMEALGWKPEVSLEQGLAETIEFFKA